MGGGPLHLATFGVAFMADMIVNRDSALEPATEILSRWGCFQLSSIRGGNTLNNPFVQPLLENFRG